MKYWSLIFSASVLDKVRKKCILQMGCNIFYSEGMLTLLELL